MNTLITVILPIYNGEQNLNTLIESMINQDIGFENLELIIIDNVSEDNSLKIIQKYTGEYPNIKSVRLENHYPTPGHSRNVGIKEASSDYIMFCDGDDLYKPNFCKKMYDIISKENIDFVSSRYTVCIDGEEQYLNNSFLDSHNSIIRLDSIDEFPEVMQTQANLTIWNKIYKKDFLIKNNIKFVEEHWAEDYLFSLECYIKAHGILLLTDYSGYLYTIAEGSKTQSKVSKDDFYNDGLLPLSKAEKLLSENNLEVMPFVSEFIISWIKIFLESDLDKNDFSEIYDSFKPWFKRYSIRTRLVNLSIPFNVAINVAVKIFSFSKYSMFLSNRILKLITN